MLLTADQRRLLGAFLRTHREALPPPVGAGRRRTPGLRREEVAMLCGLSTTWYTWIEQGRDIALSAEALARLATALRLTVAERAYLFELTCRRDPTRPPAAPQTTPTPADLLAALEAIGPPAYLLDRLWHMRGRNAAAEALFAPWLSSGEPCLLRWVFLDPAAPNFIEDWEDRARRLLAEFRADTAALTEDRGIQAMTHDLREASTAFATFWTEHAVLARDGGRRVFHHPLDGRVVYAQVTLRPATHMDHKLVMLLPLGPSGALTD